jgi:ComF family protein
VHALKYGRNLAAARPLASLAAAAARDLLLPDDTRVVPVPLHRMRRLHRGFNQSAEIARLAARQLGLRVEKGALRRVKSERTAAFRSARGRHRMARGAFRSPRYLGDRPLLLVDDVLTTGATLGACVRALYRRGARRVWAVTATRSLTP